MEDLEKHIEISADKFADSEWRYSNGYIVAEAVKQYFIVGAKSEAAKNFWQQGMYSEEEVKGMIIKFYNSNTKHDQIGFINQYSFDKWFEQNKKK